jgi:glycerophosphoryl diester phosphodiesterase
MVRCFLFFSCALLAFGNAMDPASERRARPLVVAHRGASGYAPEHTAAAYRLAIRMSANFVEQDLQMTRDGELICSHDAELSRTTDIAWVFPDRATLRDPLRTGEPRRGWFAADFTLAELKTLGAGSWYNNANPFAARDEYVGQRVQTLDEAIAAVKGNAGLYIETKHVEFYRSLGHDMVKALVETLGRHGLSGTDDSGTPVLIQSFSKASLLYAREVEPKYRRVQLLPMEDSGRASDSARVTAELAAEIAAYAYGVGPDKGMIRDASDVNVFHGAGLRIHPYTFRGSTTAVARKPLDQVEGNDRSVRQNITDDMRRYVEWGVDGGFSDYPDLWLETVRKLSGD